MMKKKLIVAVTAGLIFLASMAPVLFADGGGGGEELPPPRPLPKYSGAVQVFETDETLLLTKDSVDMVKKFFDSKKQAGDRVEAAPAEGRQAYLMSFFKTIGGQERSVPLVHFEEKTPDTNLHPALGELKGQVMMGRHSEAEYQVLENKYKNLHLAYFRQVLDDKGRDVSEGEMIYRKAFNQVHGKANDASHVPDANQKAKAADVKAQMQAMKAKGDIAGIMNLAQTFSANPRQTTAGAAAMDDMNKDTWEVWVKCLQDIEVAAFRTQLKYTAAPK